MSPQTLSRGACAYITIVVVAGLTTVAHSVYTLFAYPPPYQWLLLAGLTLFTGSFSVKVPSIAARISVSETFVFAAVLLYGPAAATTIVTLDSLVMSVWSRRERRFGVRWAFNVATVAVAMWISATAFFWLVGEPAGSPASLFPLEQRLWPLFVLAALYFLFNSGLVAVVLAFDRKQSVVQLWWANFPWFGLNYLGGVSVAALLVSYTRSVDLSAIGIILPLLLISYLTYRTSLGRIEDATRHVDQVNALYMSTIETLAMAVDAKDQITHGHIRRVQVYTVELAKRLGITDQQQLQAIAAAALLHDMGKLAIPEHILNKPGKLTVAEFDRMKSHADIGADLLSSINFPYPVVPIVRHHHEWWNGGGYPTGISGSDIPIGARVLAVVDCFDALTSDRPYRPRLSSAEAFGIISERRGSMYDPLVVDTFVAAYSEIAPIAIEAGRAARSLMSAAGTYNRDDSPLEHIRAGAIESALLSELDTQLARNCEHHAVIDFAANTLRQLMPATVFAFYRYSLHTATLKCEFATGVNSEFLNGFSIRLGERITGWTAAHRKSSVNSHAGLDLLQISEHFSPSLRSAISAPALLQDQLVGVLTAYSPREEPFTDEHRHVFEQVATRIAATFSSLKSDSNVVSFQTKN